MHSQDSHVETNMFLVKNNVFFNILCSEHVSPPLPTEQRLKDKEKLLQQLQSQYHDLGMSPTWAPPTHLMYLLTWLNQLLMMIPELLFVLVCLPSLEFPSQVANEAEPEFRTSRAAVIAPEPIPEQLEISRNMVKKTGRSVISTAHCI